MGVFNGQAVDQDVTNPAFIDANADDQAQGKIDFVNTDGVSGPSVFNIQREINSLNSFTGRISASAYNVKPGWTMNQLGTMTDDVFARVQAITANFDNSTGHTHDGTQGGGAPIAAASIASVPLRGYFKQGTIIIGVTGSSTDVSSVMIGKTASVGDSFQGVVVVSTENKVPLRQGSGTNQGDEIVDAFGNIIYGRITYAVSVWTLSYFVDIGGVETAYTFATSQDVAWFYQELFNPLQNAPVYSELVKIPSDNPTQDVIVATTSLKGKVQLSSTAPAVISASGSAGTANATVANADHTHEGVHSIGIDGDPTQALGDVQFTSGPNVSLTWSSGKLKVDALGSAMFQEIPSGVINGINATFGPLTYAPSNDSSVVVFIDYVAVPITTGFVMSGSTIVFQTGWIPQPGQFVYCYYSYAGGANAPAITGIYRVEYRTVTSLENTNKALTLGYTPLTPTYVAMDLIGGGAAFYGDDFTVSGSSLSWLGLGLDGLISTGDKLRITYIS